MVFFVPGFVFWQKGHHCKLVILLENGKDGNTSFLFAVFYGYLLLK